MIVKNATRNLVFIFIGNFSLVNIFLILLSNYSIGGFYLHINKYKLFLIFHKLCSIPHFFNFIIKMM